MSKSSLSGTKEKRLLCFVWHLVILSQISNLLLISIFLVALYFSPYFKLVAYDHDIYEHDFHCTTISDWLLTLVCN